MNKKKRCDLLTHMIEEIPTTKKIKFTKNEEEQDNFKYEKFSFKLSDNEQLKDWSDFTVLGKLKEDHQKRPLWVLPNNIIFLEAFSPIYKPASEFLIAIAEPKSRPMLIHEFELTKQSLSAAIALQYSTERILSILSKLSKTQKLPLTVENFIDTHTKYYGKAKVILYRNRYFIETNDQNIYNTLMNVDIIIQSNARVIANQKLSNNDESKIEIENDPERKDNVKQVINTSQDGILEQLDALFEANEEQFDDVNIKPDLLESDFIGRIEIDSKDYESIKRVCNEINIPLKEEFEYSIATPTNPELNIKLRPTTKIRGYQAKAISKIFNKNRAQSGIIVLPCGAGKSLIGVCTTTILKKRTIVYCNSNHSVKQWAFQYRHWTDVDTKLIFQFVSKNNSKVNNALLEALKSDVAVILITTYSIMYGSKSNEAKQIKEKLKSIEWGLAILDEVHVVPAQTFKEAINVIKSHCKIGLTATLLRGFLPSLTSYNIYLEDNKITNLEYLIGPKLYEENWKDLENEGYLARVLCTELRCEMTDIFMQEYKRQLNHWHKFHLYLANPEKFYALQYLVRYHEARRDKILVFSDDIFILTKYAKLMNKICLHGKINHDERNRVFDYFQKDDKHNVLFLSRIGDTSIDIPDANVLIQLSGHFGSRRQEAQRLGRILRPKERSNARFNAFFYTIVSLGTDEMIYSQKRQTYLIDQGFTFKILSNKELVYEKDPTLKSKFLMGTKDEQEEFLIEVLSIDTKTIEKLIESEEDEGEAIITTKKVSNMESIGGGIESLYIDYDRV